MGVEQWQNGRRATVWPADVAETKALWPMTAWNARQAALDLLQHILNGLLQGCILALVGLGFSLVWGILNIINLAHSAFIMLAANARQAYLGV